MTHHLLLNSLEGIDSGRLPSYLQNKADDSSRKCCDVPLPEELVHQDNRGKITIEDMKKVQRQWNLYNCLSGMKTSQNPLLLRKQMGLPELVKGTLMHGTTFDLDKLSSIRNRGIISGQFLGIPEDSETFYCADFFRTNSDFTIPEYIEWIDKTEVKEVGKIRIRQKPPESSYIDRNMVIIISPENADLQRLIEQDAYRNEELKNFISPPQNAFGKEDRLSAVLVGIPANFISGVILPNAEKDNLEQLKEVKRILEDIPVFDTTGQQL